MLSVALAAASSPPALSESSELQCCTCVRVGLPATGSGTVTTRPAFLAVAPASRRPSFPSEWRA